MRMNRLADYLSPHLLRKMPISYRLAAAFALLSLLPLVLAGVIAYADSTQAVVGQPRHLSTELVKHVASNIELEMARLEADSEALALSDRVQGALAQYAGDDEAKVSLARLDLTRALLERYGAADFINQKYLLDRDNRIIDSQVISSLARGVAGFAANAPRQPERPYWGAWDNAAGQQSLVLLRAIRGKADNQPAGSLFLGVRPSHFAAIFDGIDLGGGSAIFVLDAETGSVVVKTAEPSGAAPDAALAEELRGRLQRNERSGLGGGGRLSGRQLVAYARVADTSWFVVGAIALSSLSIEAQSVRDKSVLAGLAGLAIALVLAALAARRVNEMAGKAERHQLQLQQRLSERTRELAEANDKLAALSMTDALTGIANRRGFDEALAHQLRRAARTRAPLALLVLDLDYFGVYNHFYGRRKGDACLRRLAALLQPHALRAGDLAARYDGTRFALLVAHLDPLGALALAEAIRAELEAQQQPHTRSPLGRVTASIGVVALVPDAAAGADAMLRMADEAIGRARERGRNQVVLARAAVPS